MEPTFFKTYRARQQGKRGLEVMLPSKWCKAHGINTSDLLDVYIVEAETPYIVIAPHKKTEAVNK